jgi:DEAD/DEAH box helicase domain-containing protein
MGSLWQQAGRGGRGTRPSVAIFIALDSPLDQALIQNPSKLLQREVKKPVIGHAIL